MQPHSFDVLIIGAGLVGNSLSLALANHAKIAIIEANTLTIPTIFDERALALTFSTQRILQALNLWEKIQPHSTPIQQVHVSEVGHFGVTRFSAQDYDVDALGHVISAQIFSHILQESVMKNPTIQTYYGTTIQQITPFPDGYRVEIKTPQGISTLTTRLLVGADGMQSRTRELLGIAAKREDYAQTALTARIKLSRSHQNMAYERFIKQDVLAVLPASDNQVAIIWTVLSERANALNALSETDFCAEFQVAFGYRLGKFLSVEKRQIYPLRSLRAEEQVRPHAVLLGNAAHTLHPVAAQGFNLSLRDVAVLAQIVMDAMAAKENPGNLVVLKKYQDWREKKQLETMRFTQGIVRIFSKKTLPWMLLRDTGLLALEILPFAKKAIAYHAMGATDFVPKWVLVGVDTKIPRDESRGI